MPALKEAAVHGMSITPFTASGSIDEPALRRHLRYMAGGEIGVFMGAYTSGEGHLLSEAEVRRIYEIGASELGGKSPVYGAALGYTSTDTIIQKANEIASIGLDAAMIYPPAPGDPGARVTDEELERFYLDILDGVKGGTFLSLHAGKSPGVKVPLELVERLIKTYPNVRGIYVFNPDVEYVKQVVSKFGKKVRLGTAQAMTCLELGGSGYIGYEANVAPKLCTSVVKAFHAKDGTAAQKAETMTLMMRTLGKNLPPRSIKASLNELGFSVGVSRKPYLPSNEASKQELATMLRDLKIRQIEGL